MTNLQITESELRPAAKLSPAAFLLAVLSFALPFISVSCQRQAVAKLSGLELATGTTIHQPALLGAPQEKKVEGLPIVAIALLAAVGGLVLAVLKQPKAQIGSTALAFVSAGCLLMMRSELNSQITEQGMGLLVVNYHSGFYLALLFLMLSAVLSFLRYQIAKPPVHFSASPYAPPVG